MWQSWVLTSFKYLQKPVVPALLPTIPFGPGLMAFFFPLPIPTCSQSRLLPGAVCVNELVTWEKFPARRCYSSDSRRQHQGTSFGRGREWENDSRKWTAEKVPSWLWLCCTHSISHKVIQRRWRLSVNGEGKGETKWFWEQGENRWLCLEEKFPAEERKGRTVFSLLQLGELFWV